MTRDLDDLEVKACWRYESCCRRLPTKPYFNQPARAAGGCCVFRGRLRRQAAFRTFGRIAAENAEFGSQKRPTIALVGALQVATSVNLLCSPVFLVETLPPPRQPQAHLSPLALGALFCIVPKLGRPGEKGPLAAQIAYLPPKLADLFILTEITND